MSEQCLFRLDAVYKFVVWVDIPQRRIDFAQTHTPPLEIYFTSTFPPQTCQLPAPLSCESLLFWLENINGSHSVVMSKEQLQPLWLELIPSFNAKDRKADGTKSSEDSWRSNSIAITQDRHIHVRPASSSLIRRCGYHRAQQQSRLSCDEIAVATSSCNRHPQSLARER